MLLDNYHFSCKNMKRFNAVVAFFTSFAVRPVLRVGCTSSALFSAERRVKVRQCLKPDMIHSPRDGWCAEFIRWRWMFLTHFDAPETRKKALLNFNSGSVLLSLLSPGLDFEGTAILQLQMTRYKQHPAPLLLSLSSMPLTLQSAAVLWRTLRLCLL